MAYQDQPVNGKASKLSLLSDGNLILNDAGKITIWTASIFSISPVQLKLMDNGNLVLRTLQGTVLWQSFDSPTDILLPGQPLTEKASLISSRSTTNYSSGFYKLYFDNDNVLRMLFKGPNLSSVYWPSPWLLPVDAGRSTNNITKIAVLDHFGHFKSSDTFNFNSVDYVSRRHRRLKLDSDGNLRLYSFNQENSEWDVSWEAFPESCATHGICGANSLCTYHPVNDRTCYCLQGHKIKNPNDWTDCQPEINPLTCNNGSSESASFVRLPSTEFFSYDLDVYKVSSLGECQSICLNLCDAPKLSNSNSTKSELTIVTLNQYCSNEGIHQISTELYV